MQRDDAVTWGVVDEESGDDAADSRDDAADSRDDAADPGDDDTADSARRDGVRALVATLCGRRLLGGVLGLVGLSVLLVGAYTLTEPVVLSLLFLVAPAFVLLVVVGFLRGGDLIDPRI